MIYVLIIGFFAGDLEVGEGVPGCVSQAETAESSALPRDPDKAVMDGCIAMHGKARKGGRGSGLFPMNRDLVHRCSKGPAPARLPPVCRSMSTDRFQCSACRD